MIKRLDVYLVDKQNRIVDYSTREQRKYSVLEPNVGERIYLMLQVQ